VSRRHKRLAIRCSDEGGQTRPLKRSALFYRLSLAGLAALISTACGVRAASAIGASDLDIALVYLGGTLIMAAAAAVTAVHAFRRHSR
jgi:hypothetical protein